MCYRYTKEQSRAKKNYKATPQSHHPDDKTSEAEGLEPPTVLPVTVFETATSTSRTASIETCLSFIQAGTAP